jgi:hypothetical protein
LEALLLAGVALWCFLTAVAGGLVGLVLGNIRLPVIVLAASSPAAGAGAAVDRRSGRRRAALRRRPG